MFERGFKTWCEKLSLQFRKDLGRLAVDPLEPAEVAKHLCIQVLSTSDFPTLSATAKRDLDADNAGWSAVTVESDGTKMIIVNDTHSSRRRSSDVMHELAHHILEHAPSEIEVSTEGLLMLESYSRKQEEEADWLSGCLLLPRPALVHIRKRFRDHEEAAERYVVSMAMLKYRLDVSGVNFQYR